MSKLQPSNIQGMSLRRKILLPFFCVLFLLGIAATLGSALFIRDALYKTADQRLATSQEIAFRELKEQEVLLRTFAPLVNYAFALSPSSQAPLDITRFQEQLFDALRGADITVGFFAAALGDDLPYPSLRSLIKQAENSGTPAFGFAVDTGTVPALCLAIPTLGKERIGQIILLQTSLEQAFLKKLTTGDRTRLFLLSRDGELLTAGEGPRELPKLTAAERQAVLSGTPVFRKTSGPLPHRYRYQALPLGSTDLVISAVELPTADLGMLISTLATRSVLTILAALLLGAYAYCWLIRQIMIPVQELMMATNAVSEGNLDYRIRHLSRDELGRAAESFNLMLTQLGALYEEKVEQEKRLARTEGELKYVEMLEQKNREIARTNRELKNHLKEISALYQLNQAMISTLDLGVLFDRILHVLKDVIRCEQIVLLLYNQGMEELEVRKTIGIESDLLKGLAFRLDEGITGRAARTQQLQYVRDVTSETLILHYKGKRPGRGSMVSAPMVVKGRLAGVLNLHKELDDGFPDKELRLIQAIANQAAIAIENAQLYEKSCNLSNTDELTQLANRRHFQAILQREVAQSRRFSSNFSLILIDIDQFKTYNDSHGHLSGDLVLKRVADLLLQNTRGIDLVARFGGEEFIILLPKTTREGAFAAAEKLRQCVAEENFPGAGQSQPGGRLTLSLGVAEYPADSKDIFELIDLADRALYMAKEAGRNRTVAWKPRPHLQAKPSPAPPGS